MNDSHRIDPLPGGARLVTAELPDRVSASLVLMFGVGSSHEPEALSGISHFLEHLVFKGTERRPGSQEIAETIEGVGGIINAWTDHEATAYWARVPSEQLNLAVEVLVDVVSQPRLMAEDLERERGVILEELKMHLDQPEDYVHKLFEEIMWPKHPLGRDIIGDEDTINRLSHEDLFNHLRQNYGRSNLVVGVCGPLKAESALHEIRSNLEVMPDAQPPLVWPEPSPLEQPTVRVQYKDSEQAHVCLGMRGYSYLHPDRHALDALTALMGEGMSSRLFLEIREHRALAYDIYAYTSKCRNSGYFGVYLGVDPSKAEEAVARVYEQLEKVVAKAVTEAELRKVKEFNKGRLRLSLEGTNAMATWLAQQQLLTGEVKTIEEVIERIEMVTVEDVHRVAEEILASPPQLAVVGPFSSDNGFRSALGL